MNSRNYRLFAFNLMELTTSPNSDETTPNIFTGESAPIAQPEAPKQAIRTDVAVAELAKLGKDTIRKIEKIEAVASPEIKAALASVSNATKTLLDLESESANGIRPRNRPGFVRLVSPAHFSNAT